MPAQTAQITNKKEKNEKDGLFWSGSAGVGWILEACPYLLQSLRSFGNFSALWKSEEVTFLPVFHHFPRFCHRFPMVSLWFFTSHRWSQRWRLVGAGEMDGPRALRHGPFGALAEIPREKKTKDEVFLHTLLNVFWHCLTYFNIQKPPKSLYSKRSPNRMISNRSTVYSMVCRWFSRFTQTK